MRFIALIFSLFLALPALAGFQGYNGTTDLKVFNKLKCSTGVTCTKVGDKFQIVAGGATSLTGTGAGTISGFLAPQVAASATTITAAQCGSTFSNAGAVQMELPEASTVIGCTLTFVTLNASNFDINPEGSDQIVVSTNAAGDAIRNATVGNAITIRAVSASQWAPLAISGTWSDIN